MPDKVTPLRIVAAPRAEEQARAELMEMLSRTMAEARDGKITEIFMILKHPGDDEWSDCATPTRNFTGWIGKLEVTKQAWIAQFNEAERKCHE